MFQVRLPIKDHSHWLDSPTELIVQDAVAEPVFRQNKALETTTSIEYLTETPYHNPEKNQVLHEPLLINDRAYDYDEDYYYDYYYDEGIFENARNDTDQRTPRTPR